MSLLPGVTDATIERQAIRRSMSRALADLRQSRSVIRFDLTKRR
jgi:hypothetical protein